MEKREGTWQIRAHVNQKLINYPSSSLIRWVCQANFPTQPLLSRRPLFYIFIFFKRDIHRATFSKQRHSASYLLQTLAQARGITISILNVIPQKYAGAATGYR